MVKQNTIVKPAEPLPPAAVKQIQGILVYFRNYHSFKEIKYLPRDFTLGKTRQVFGFQWSDNFNIRDDSSFISYEFNQSKILSVKNYDYFIHISYNPENTSNTEEQLPNLALEYGRNLKISKGGQVIYNQDIIDLTTNILKKRHNELQSEKSLTETVTNCRVRVMYVFRFIIGSTDEATGEPVFNRIDYDAFIEVK
jgi:hypothetical protein